MGGGRLVWSLEQTAFMSIDKGLGFVEGLCLGLEWVWVKNFYKEKMHIRDREPLGPKRWYIREFR